MSNNYQMGDITLDDDQQMLIDKLGLWVDGTYTTKNYSADTHGNRLFVYTGPAGSGKTTIVQVVIDYLGLESKFVILSPTWKAANNMKNVFPEAKSMIMTVHRFAFKLLDNLEDGDILEFEQKDMNITGLEFIFIEEGSMVEKETVDYILTSGLRVVLFGDIRQIPPPGSKLNEYLMNCDHALLESHRQYKDSDIIRFANDVYNKRISIQGSSTRSQVINLITYLSSVYTKGDVVFWTEEQYFQALRKSKILPDISLCFMNETKIDLTNNIRQRRYKDGILIPHYPESTIEYPCIGDIIMCTKAPSFKVFNQYGEETQIYNSYEYEIIKINYLNPENDFIEFDLRSCDEDGLILNNVPAYLTTFYYTSPNSIVKNDEYRVRFTFSLGNTIHKSQGSEYDLVAFLSSYYASRRSIQDGQSPPPNNLFYVAATRAKKKLVVVICYLYYWDQNYGDTYGYVKLPYIESDLPEAIRKSNRTNLISD